MEDRTWHSVNEDIVIQGMTAGMSGEHFKHNPYNPKTQASFYRDWSRGWDQGRVCLQWDNPFGIPVREVCEPNICPRLVPTHEKIPIVPGFRLPGYLPHLAKC